MATLVNKTIKSSGGDYASLADLAADSQDLVSADQYWVVTCDNFEDTDGTADFNGWVTDSTRYLHIVAADSHGGAGAITTSAYRHTRTTAGNNVKITNIGSGGKLIFEGLQFHSTHASGINVTPAYDAAHTVTFLNCLFEAAYCNIYHTTPNTGTITFINCTAISRNAGSYYSIYVTTAGVLNLDHCVIIGTNGYGIYNTSSASACVCRNCYFQGTAGSINNNTKGTFTTCATSDAQSPDASLDNIAYTTDNFTNVTADAEDFHLPDEDSALYAVGTAGVYATDIDGEDRKSPPDIGCDEIPAEDITDNALFFAF